MNMSTTMLSFLHAAKTVGLHMRHVKIVIIQLMNILKQQVLTSTQQKWKKQKQLALKTVM